MASYFRVEGGRIVEGPKTLPKAWRNISGLDRATPAHLKALGWLPQVKIGDDAVVDPAREKLTGPEHVVGPNSVTSTWAVTAKSKAETDADAATADAQIDLRVSGVTTGVLGIALLDMVNAVRALQGNPALTMPQYRSHLKSLARGV